MLTQTREPMNCVELAHIERLQKPTIIERLLRRRWEEITRDYADKVVEMFHVSVERCFTPNKFNQVMPIYFLDVGQNQMLLLSGQWLYDSTMIVADDLFDQWNSETEFFKSFTLRRAPNSGIVLSLEVEGTALIEAEGIDVPGGFNRAPESELIKGASDTLIMDLKNAQII